MRVRGGFAAGHDAAARVRAQGGPRRVAARGARAPGCASRPPPLRASALADWIAMRTCQGRIVSFGAFMCRSGTYFERQQCCLSRWSSLTLHTR